MELNHQENKNILDKNLVQIVLGIILIAALISIGGFVYKLIKGSGNLFSAEKYFLNEETTEEECNVRGIELHGTLYTYLVSVETSEDIPAGGTADASASEDIVFAIDSADKNDEIKAILLEIDSYGGMPVAAEEVAEALKNSSKPTVALIRGAATSGAYWAGSSAGVIFASKNSEIGGIGINMSYLDQSQKNQRDGLTYNQIIIGKYKDTTDPNKVLTKEEKEMLLIEGQIIYDNFITAISENRGIEVDKVRVLADGTTMLGEKALSNNLIDYLGGYQEVENYLKEKIGEEVKICW